MRNLIVGIDPDTDKSGVAFLHKRSSQVDYFTVTFFELLEKLKYWKSDIDRVYVEAGWLNKSVWHGNKFQGTNIATRIGRNVGANHAVGLKIVEMLQYLGFQSRDTYYDNKPEENISYYDLRRPSSQKWDKEKLAKVTGITKRSNQDERDAIQLIWGR